MIRLAWRLAGRELRGGLRQFVIFIACLALGVAAIAGANGLDAALSRTLSEDAQALLGGDAELRLSYRAVSPEERALAAANGDLADISQMRAMARTPDDAAQSLVEVKAVDAAYPLYGHLDLAPAMTPGEAFAEQGGVWGAVVEAGLLDRLDLKVGGRLTLGQAQLEVRAVIVREPDRVASTFSLGPRLMISPAALAASGLVQPGALVTHILQVRFHPGVTSSAFKTALDRQFPNAGWLYRDAAGVAPGIKRFLDQLTLFLTLVGLTALLVGGIGVSNAVSAFLEGRLTTIAILKSLGASRRTVELIYGLQVLLVAAAGILLGLLVGAALPWLAVLSFGDALPVAARLGVYPAPLLLAGVFGLLITLCFASWPLARAGATPAASLFRDIVAPSRRLPGAGAVLLVGLAGAGLAGLVIGTAADHRLAAWFTGGAVLSLFVFLAAGEGLVRLARWASHRVRGAGAHPAWRLGLSALHRPGSATAGVVLSLGLGLTVLVAVALIEANLSRQLNERIPAEAPTFFFIDIQPDQLDLFRGTVADAGGRSQEAPMIRGRITRIDGRPVEEVAIAPDAQWAVRGDRGLTSAASPPKDARIVAGQWWPADYQGPPLVSLDAGIAKGFGLTVGQQITVNVLGRDITAKIANLREIDWSSLSMNFTFILDPAALAGAPVSYIATVAAPGDRGSAVERAVTRALPGISSIRVKEALDSVKAVAGNVAIAIRAAASVTLLAGALVLAGAIAASRQRRIRETVLLKVLGAGRRDLLAALALEYLALGAATALLAGLLGAAAAYGVLVGVMHADWIFLPGPMLIALFLALAAVTLAGLAGTWRILATRAAPYLRHS